MVEVKIKNPLLARGRNGEFKPVSISLEPKVLGNSICVLRLAVSSKREGKEPIMLYLDRYDAIILARRILNELGEK